MKNLLNATDNNEIIERINKLSNQSQALWGKMNVAQMMAHCQQPLKMAFIDKGVKKTFLGMVFGGLIKKQLLGIKPFKKNLPTDSSFKIVDERDFDNEKVELIRLIKGFSVGGSEAVVGTKHPIFGTMTPNDWGILSWKHLDHHLQQFGA
ncbi:DUF1569 domain-containing protein [Solitalea sp. MAHUQ-68]|uniref:DUF1569 domain-containing protein n=1 Tax=Solitalea agri TaxID=2953739 RepID=A0A9X2F2X2_9SPHI|nr:DUF1569 domain-containing protein [Solitalea agri]MCO4293194.1 DUF1569 domain-containing protein [Solitalea agri]